MTIKKNHLALGVETTSPADQPDGYVTRSAGALAAAAALLGVGRLGSGLRIVRGVGLL